MRVMLLFFFSNFTFTGGGTALLFELGRGPTKNDRIEAWSTREVASAIWNIYGGLILIIARDISWNVINRAAKVELHLCACDGDNRGDESSLYGNDDELYTISFPTLK